MLYFCLLVISTIVVAGVFGLLIGVVLSTASQHKKSASGTLKVNTTDPDGPYLFLELSKEDLADIASKKQVILDVKIVSQK